MSPNQLIHAALTGNDRRWKFRCAHFKVNEEAVSVLISFLSHIFFFFFTKMKYPSFPLPAHAFSSCTVTRTHTCTTVCSCLKTPTVELSLLFNPLSIILSIPVLHTETNTPRLKSHEFTGVRLTDRRLIVCQVMWSCIYTLTWMSAQCSLWSLCQTESQ